ncbi:transposase [Streptomyces huasconensis]|uniref:transposase n=1 Tax=Streptomyces huasconensis TaxID=1854574 RepID=UPI0036F56541
MKPHGEPPRPPGGGGAGGEGLGRSRDGFTSKLHLNSDGRCRPLSLLVTPGRRADRTQFKPVLEKIRVAKSGPDRPRTKPDSVAADRAYGNGPCREYLRQRGIRHTIPEKTDSQAARLRKGSRDGRPRRSCRGVCCRQRPRAARPRRRSPVAVESAAPDASGTPAAPVLVISELDHRRPRSSLKCSNQLALRQRRTLERHKLRLPPFREVHNSGNWRRAQCPSLCKFRKSRRSPTAACTISTSTGLGLQLSVRSVPANETMQSIAPCQISSRPTLSSSSGSEKSSHRVTSDISPPKLGAGPPGPVQPRPPPPLTPSPAAVLRYGTKFRTLSGRSACPRVIPERASYAKCTRTVRFTG